MPSELIEISVVAPVFDEEGNAAELAREIAAAFDGRAYEMIFVDDASRDRTLAVLTELKAEIPTLRVIAHEKNAGQSRATRTGILAARGNIIVTIDGDRQNDPADGPALVDRLKAGGAGLGLVSGRRARRQDGWSKKIASRIGNGVRQWMLKDQSDDAGCGLKAFWKDAFLRLPYFDHVHRYIPALMLREGYRIEAVDVNHRHRVAGVSKYTNLRRLYASLGDMTGMMWLNARARKPGATREV
jgi:glycosyltransferase involved in cell wall biosynthesis